MRHFCLIITVLLCLNSTLFPEEKNAIYHNKTGWENLSKGDYFRAIISFKEALKMNPKYSKALIGLGKAYLNTEAYEESLKLFNDALNLEKENVEAVNGLAYAMIGLGRYNDALVYFDRALKISEENPAAKYGIAYVYYLMDKMLWSERKLKGILKVNPYHYQSLLLMADIKTRIGRTEEAKKYIQKAIDSKAELPDAYIKYGQVNLKDYRSTDNAEYLEEAIHEFKKALAIHPENLQANRSLGYVSLLLNDYEEAIKYFESAISAYPENSVSIYNLAIAYIKNKNNDLALNTFVKGLQISPSDSLLQARFEDFLVLNDFAMGHPLRVKFSEEHYDTAVDRIKENLSDEAKLHLLRSLLLNPVNKNARENLRDYYFTHNYYRFYINELKTLFKIYPEERYQDILNVAVIKRRDRLYQKAGYADELPPRDVPAVLVLDLWPLDEITPHLDAGTIIANYISFTMTQFGRMDTLSVKKRIEINSKLKDGKKNLSDNLKELAGLVKSNEIDELDFILFGTFRETSNVITINCELLDFHTGVIISSFNLTESGKENVPALSLRVARRLYDSIPFHGRILKSDSNNIIINLGLFDGIKPGDLVEVQKLKSPEEEEKIKIKERLIFVINESDTLVSSAKPLKPSDAQLIEINDRVYPLKKRRSKLIE